MPALEEDIIAKLLDTAGVSSMVGSRVFPGLRPQGSLLPSLVLITVSENRIYTDDGEAGIAEELIQIDCWGETYSDAKVLSRAVIDSLSAFFGTVGTTTFQNILLNSIQDLTEQGSNMPEYLRRTSLDFRVWYET